MKLFFVRMIAITGLTCASIAFAADDAQTLMKNNNCLFCHQLEGKKAGPGFVDIARKYKNVADAASKLEAKILNGSVGTWGTMPMPAMSKLKPAEIKVLVTYILSTAK
jgi:cytochrome c